MFIEKTKSELNGLDADQLQTYYVEKLQHEKAELVARVEKLERATTNEDLKADIKTLKEKQLQTLTDALKQQGEVIQKLKEGSIRSNDVRTLDESITEAYLAHAEDFKKLKNGRHDFKLTLKVVGDMTLAGNVSGGTIPQPQRLEGVNDIVERELVVLPLIPKLTTTKNSIEWVYESGQEGTIDGTAEGAAKDQIDNNFVVTSVSLVKRAAYFKVSTEMLDDVSFMRGWIRNKLLVRLYLDVDNQVLNGNNTPPNLNGLVNQATTFAAGTFALTVDNANNVDSLVVAMNQIRLANHKGNLTIFMYPSDVTALKLVKLTSTDKRYVDRLLQVGSTLMLDGVPIKETKAITAGTFLVGDMSKAMVVQKSDITLELGLDGNDFTKNMRTVLGEWRGQVLIETNELTAFVKGTFATTNAALETA